MFEGLQEIKLSNSSLLQTLRIPASVNKCEIQDCEIRSLIFEDSDIWLQQTLKNTKIISSFKCLRRFYNSSLDISQYHAPYEIIISPVFFDIVSGATKLGTNLNDCVLVYLPCSDGARSYTPHTSLTFWCIFNHVGVDNYLSASYVVGLPLH